MGWSVEQEATPAQASGLMVMVGWGQKGKGRVREVEVWR